MQLSKLQNKVELADQSGDMAGERVGVLEAEQKAQLRGESWYHGPFPSGSLDRVLVNDGDFLVRFNDKEHGHGFVLSVRGRFHSIHHFHLHATTRTTTQTIATSRAPFTLSRQTRAFSSVKSLVEHYWRSDEALPVKGWEGVRMKAPAERGRWELRSADVKMGTRLGKGAFGDIWEGTVTRSSTTAVTTDAVTTFKAAVKTWDTTAGHQYHRVYRGQVQGEALKQLRFQHENVIRVVGLVVREDPKMVVLEWMSKGKLLGYLRKSGRGSSVEWLTSVSLDVSRGMEYLEGLNCVHHEVSGRSILLNSEMVAKILAPSYSNSVKFKLLMGKNAIKWMAPESMRSGDFTTKSDVWSFGVLAWEVYSFGAEPWSGQGCDEVKNQVLVRGSRLSPPSTAPAAVLGLMGNCWATDPGARPSFAKIAATLSTLPHSPRPL